MQLVRTSLRMTTSSTTLMSKQSQNNGKGVFSPSRRLQLQSFLKCFNNLGIKHKINLHDETLFKERLKSIHPRETEAVKQHPKELLDVGIFRESERLFTSPILLVREKRIAPSNCDSTTGG